MVLPVEHLPGNDAFRQAPPFVRRSRIEWKGSLTAENHSLLELNRFHDGLQ
jgi:hypothetical protein